MATKKPDGTEIPLADRSYFFGTPKGFEQPMMRFIDNSELDGPSLYAAVKWVFENIHRRLEDDRRLLNAAARASLDFGGGLGLLTKKVSAVTLVPDAPG